MLGVINGLARVLVVDDDIDITSSMGELLTLAGYEVCIANTGTDALRCVEDFEPEIALLDLDLGDMTGFDVVRSIMISQVERPYLIAVTGRFDAKRQTIDAGFDRFYPKPLDGNSLIDVVAEARAQRMRGRSAHSSLAFGDARTPTTW